VAVGPQDRQHVGEVFLAFGVVGGHSLDRIGEQVAVKGVHAGVISSIARCSGVASASSTIPAIAPWASSTIRP